MRVISEWGLTGAKALAEQADVFIVVDVLSFSTCVDVACANGARVFPFPIGDREAAAVEAHNLGAILAGKRSDTRARFSLSAPSLCNIPAGTKLVLPSPNGSRITFFQQGKTMLAGCLRNARAVAQAAQKMAKGGTIAVIPAGERWRDGGLRPAIEDQIGAGAIIHELQGEKSPEAAVAEATFTHAQSNLHPILAGSASGQELINRGFPQDVDIACELNTSQCAPILKEGAYIKAQG